jgi:hypothetical protein
MGLLEYILGEGRVIKGAPVAFSIAVVLAGSAVWGGATVFYKQEVASAKQETATSKQETMTARQETATVGQQRDFYKDRLDAEIKSAPNIVQGGAPSSYKPSPIIIRPKGATAPKAVSIAPPAPAAVTNNATSYFQSGGITAGSVNLGPQQRVLTDEMKRQLLDKVPKDKPVSIMAVLGDSEAVIFATDIFSFMNANGFKMSDGGISQGVFTAPVTGTQVQLADDKTSIVVGANLPPRP